jgi:hypothetical protein
MPRYLIERIDVSYIEVDADNEDEAFDIANDLPHHWDIDIGEATIQEMEN